MRRAVVCVATTPYYQRGQARLAGFGQHIGAAELVMLKQEPPGSPVHSEVPYAFKAFALQQAADAGADLLLWCDASILPVRSLEPLWKRIQHDGYWFSQAGWSNYEWTADSAYQDLFPVLENEPIETARSFNRQIPHVVATAFGLNLGHPKGRAFLEEYYRLASKSRAFCGPWSNADHPDHFGAQWRWQPNTRCAPCGPPDVRGHRHDQTAASVIAWRLSFQLTSPPDIFAYGRADEPHDERTLLLADGSYT
jgi:hypothetical protein